MLSKCRVGSGSGPFCPDPDPTKIIRKKDLRKRKVRVEDEEERKSKKKRKWDIRKKGREKGVSEAVRGKSSRRADVTKWVGVDSVCEKAY